MLRLEGGEGNGNRRIRFPPLPIELPDDKMDSYEDPATPQTSGTIHRLSDMALSVLWLRKPFQS